MNIWDLAIAQQKQKLQAGHQAFGIGGSQILGLVSQQVETTLLVVGSKRVGKTTLIQRFLERQETPKPTLALEYTFGRRAKVNLSKDVCHIWELGGGTSSLGLLETPFSPSKLQALRVVVMVDLSEPFELWYTLDAVMGALWARLESAERVAGTAGGHRSSSGADRQHPDWEATNPFPLPLAILGGKYDLFQDMEPEKKKIVCRALRSYALIHGASLQFYSAKDTGLVKKAKDLLNHLAFNTDPAKGVSQDYNKPLFVPAWSDTFEAITGNLQGIGHQGLAKGPGGAKQNLQVWKHQFETFFPQSINEKTALPPDPAKDPNFAEPLIDQVRAQKDDDLERYRREVDRRSKQGWEEDLLQ